MRNKARLFLFPFLFVALATVAVSAGSSGYNVSKKTVLGGEGVRDYLIVDSKARRVHISRGTHVMAPTAQQQQPRTPMVTGTFTLIAVTR